jgi:membrane protein YqaA with SNARE-associated domain
MKYESRLAASSPEAPRARAWLVLRFVLGLVLLLGLVILLVRTLKPELESLGTLFVARFGLAGVMVGTLLADGFHCPIPPQFYMLLAIAAGASALTVLTVVVLGSILGGAIGFTLARRLASIPRLSIWLDRVGGRVSRHLGQRHPYRSVFFLSLTPMAFSVLCYAAGLYRLRRGPLMLLLGLRVPKLALYYYLVSIGWNAP